MNHLILACFLCISMVSCTRYDAVRIVRAAATGNPATAAQALARDKAIGYATNPEALATDIKHFSSMIEKLVTSVEKVWGKENVRLPEPKSYVKYTDNYLSRASIDFDSGVITIETLATETPQKKLKNAIVTTLLTPGDPRAVDLYSAQTIKLGDTPFLLGEVKDQDNKDIRWAWRAEHFADYLIKNSLETKKNGHKTVHSVTISMVRDHLDIRAKKYEQLVKSAAKRFSVSKNLIYAIMKVESDFNPFATSAAMALGLMQVVPKTAGSDVYQFLHGKKGTPSRKDLLMPATNITYGSAYLHLLDTRFLNGIKSPVSREYCVIAGYNGGAGTVLNTFNENRKKAVAAINATPPAKVYSTLRKHLAYQETRRYLGKVLDAKKHFVNF